MDGNEDTTHLGYGRLEVTIEFMSDPASNDSSMITTTVCADNFDDREARVVCRQLNSTYVKN